MSRLARISASASAAESGEVLVNDAVLSEDLTPQAEDQTVTAMESGNDHRVEGICGCDTVAARDDHGKGRAAADALEAVNHEALKILPTRPT
ncbi:MAG: hypothetical protein HN976_02110 [Lentisphaerae bacterium]|nr:hypothetical protein [Lentisphaerota bacterium]MBT7053855.1 hypothetical protein [Lentisphaerota bacterium]